MATTEAKPATPTENGAQLEEAMRGQVIRPDDPGYTVDTDVNRMRWEMQPRRTRKRIDRMFLRSAGRLRPEHIELVGERAAPGDPTLFASDHFGLKARFRVT